MQKRVKKTTKYILTFIPFLLFIVASILVLVIAQGKTISDGGKLIESSIIRINSYPSNPVVTINGKPVTLSDSKTANVLPGRNVVKLSKPGYYDWEKEVVNYAGIIRELYVQMYPTDIAFEKTTVTPVDYTAFSTDNQFIYNVRKTTNNIQISRLKIVRGIFEFNSTNNEEIILSIPRSQNLSNDFTIEEFSTNQNNSYSLLKISIGDNQYYYLINFSSETIEFLDTLTGVSTTKAEFSNNSQSLIFIGNGITGEFNYLTGAKYLISSRPLESYYIRGGNLLFTDNELVQAYSEGVSKPYTVFNSLMDTTISNDFELIDISSDGTIYIYKNNGNLVWFDTVNKYKTLLDSDLEIVKISADTKLLIFKKDNLHYTFSFEKNIIDSKSYNLSVSEIDLSAYEPEGFQIINGDKNIAVFTTTGKLLIMDYDGKNIRDILPDFSFEGSEILMVNNTEMYALVREIVNSDSAIEASYVYKFNLESID